MESRKPESMRPVSPTRKRLEDALAVLAQERAAENPKDAREMFVKAFAKAEESLPKKDRILNLSSAENMTQMLHEGTLVRVSAYKSHVLFLGEHGAIEVRLYSQADNPRDETELVVRHAEFPIVFEKVGADGKSLWEK